MRRRTISDAELVHNLRFELEELRRGLEAVVERLEALEEPIELDAGRNSRRVAVVGGEELLGPVGEVAARLRPLFESGRVA